MDTGLGTITMQWLDRKITQVKAGWIGNCSKGLIALAAFSCLSSASSADITTYSTNKRVFKVGVLLVDSTGYNFATNPPAPLPGGPENPDPHVFYIADSRQDLKPANWELVNPLAPKTVTSDIYARWSQPGTGRDQANPYKVGQQVTKDMACYWEVKLSSASVADLAQFDLLFVTNHRTVFLTPEDREKLRKVVDAGAVLWMEDCSRMRLHPRAPFFLEDVQFTSGGGQGKPVVYMPGHPLLNQPYALSSRDISRLGDANYGGGRAIASHRPGALLATDPPLLERPNPQVLHNVVGNSAVTSSTGEYLPYIAAGSYGSGGVLVTAGDSGCDINDYVGGINIGSGGNSGAYSGKNLWAAQSEDLRFVYNAIAWGSSSTAYRKNNRRVGSSLEMVGAPLIDGFAVVPTSVDPAFGSVTSPLVTQGLTVATGVSGGIGFVRAYVSQPSLAAGDRGLPDLIFGTAWDEVWRAPLGSSGIPSTPVAAQIYVGQPAPADVVFVTLGDGTLARIPLQAKDAAGNLIALPGVETNAPVSIGSPSTYEKTAYNAAPAPVVFENRVYVVEPSGLVRCIDARTLTTLWWSHTEALNPSVTPKGSPTLGVSRQDVAQIGFGRRDASIASRSNGNTNDVMLYTPVVDADGNAHIYAYWLGTRHEVVRTDEGASGNYRTRVALDNSAPVNNRHYVALGRPEFITPRVRVYDSADAMNLGVLSTTYTGTFRADGSGFVEVRGSNGDVPVGPRPVISVDYDVLYVTADATPPGLEEGIGARLGQPLVIPQLDVTPVSSGLDTVAMTNEDLLVFAARQTNDRNGSGLTSIIGVNEQFSVGATKFRQNVAILEDLGPISAPVDRRVVTELPTLRNRLIFTGGISTSMGAILAPAWEGLTNVRIMGSPAVSADGISYVVAQATSLANNGTVSVLVALQMDKDVTLNLPEAYNPAYPVSVRQYNALTYPATGSDPVQTTTAILPANAVDNVVSSVQLSGDAKRGKITVTDMRHPSGVRFSSTQSFVVSYVPAGTQNPVTVVLTPLPGSAGVPVTATADEDGSSVRSVGGAYSPVLWYYILPGAPTSSPTVSGNHIYFAIGQNIVALDVNPAESDPSVRVGFGEQVINVASSIVNAATSQPLTVATNHLRWVRNAGAVIASPPVVGGNIVAVSTGSGPVVFQASTTLVTDAKRILEVGADGAATWVMDGTVDTDVVGGEVPVYDPSLPDGIANPPATGRRAVRRSQLARPSVARKLSGQDYLIADTGNNRVLRVDRGGRIRWELTALRDTFKILASTDSTLLNNPTDVHYSLLPTADPSDPTKAPIGYEMHYLIADSGNYRAIEVVDYFDLNGNYRTIGGDRGEGVVVWVSRLKSREGRNLRIQKVQRISTSVGGVTGIPQIVAVVANAQTAGVGGQDIDSSGGAVIRLEYRPYNTFTVLRNAAGGVLPPAPWPSSGTPTGSGYPWPTAAAGASAQTTEPVSNGTVTATIQEVVLPNGDTYKITSPTYFEQVTLPNGTGGTKPVYMIADANGVYQIEDGPMGRRVATWYFNQSHYNTMNLNPAFSADGINPRLLVAAGLDQRELPRFQPTAIRRLLNGRYLITNSAVGQSSVFQTGQFAGEVLEVIPEFNPDGTPNGGRFGGFSVPQVISRPNGLGVGRNTNVQWMGTTSNNTSLIDQPLFGDRL